MPSKLNWGSRHQLQGCTGPHVKRDEQVHAAKGTRVPLSLPGLVLALVHWHLCRVGVPTLPLSGCAALSELLNLSELSHLHLELGDDDGSNLTAGGEKEGDTAWGTLSSGRCAVVINTPVWPPRGALRASRHALGEQKSALGRKDAVVP